MNTTEVVVIVIAAVLVLAAVGIVADRKWRHRRLRERFGPEYDRTVRNSPSMRQAEADLRQRAAERDRLLIRPLSDIQKERYEQHWRQVQGDFVDVPGSALARADALLTDVMIDCGYPMEDFDQGAALVSVDHPQVVEHYRVAHRIFVASRSTQVSTEEIRRAFVSYRALFSELMAEGASSDEGLHRIGQIPDDESPSSSHRFHTA